MRGKLYIVATPIGNLQDMSLRAIEILRSVDLIACEDTRHSIKLLNHFRISNKLVSYHEHNELERAEEIVEKITAGFNVAVISDAGTPGISDPSFRAVKLAADAGIEVIAVPGAAAFVSAAVVSGLPTDALFFAGFLPSKKSERRNRLSEIAAIPATLVIYESPHRIGFSLKDCLEILGDREASISRELTKLHEETIRGRLSMLAERYSKENTKGEIVICIERGNSFNLAPSENTTLAERIAQLESQGIDHKSALKTAAKEFGIKKSEAYRMLLDHTDK